MKRNFLPAGVKRAFLSVFGKTSLAASLAVGVFVLASCDNSMPPEEYQAIQGKWTATFTGELVAKFPPPLNDQETGQEAVVSIVLNFDPYTYSKADGGYAVSCSGDLFQFKGYFTLSDGNITIKADNFPIPSPIPYKLEEDGSLTLTIGESIRIPFSRK